MRTSHSIIHSFTERVSNKEIIPPDEWMKGAMYLNVLQHDEKNKMFQLEQTFVRKVLEETEKGASHALAEKVAKMSDEWLAFKNQESFCKQIEEFIRLAKKQATINFEQGA
jgi:hypothetical protein